MWFLIRAFIIIQEMSAPVMDGNGTVTGHIISTTIGGKNGEPKQVSLLIQLNFASVGMI